MKNFVRRAAKWPLLKRLLDPDNRAIVALIVAMFGAASLSMKGRPETWPSWAVALATGAGASIAFLLVTFLLRWLAQWLNAVPTGHRDHK
ncbi:MAG TPA: hypothetical protein VG826_03165 [Pirellulales bacterium]|nr:hypothetical protein [Pirellulales bacterium]